MVPGDDLDPYSQQFVGEVSLVAASRIPLEGPKGKWLLRRGDGWVSLVLFMFANPL